MVSKEKIDRARLVLNEVVTKTALQKNMNLSEKYMANIFLKREDNQVVRSFKIRGAYLKIASLDLEKRKKGIVCASAGNHAQGVALACAKLGINGKIYMPNPTPAQKISKVRQFGKDWIQTILVGDTYDDAYEAAFAECEANELSFIHPFDDPTVITGQGTIAAEILEDAADTLDYILIAVGGGGLISGVGTYFKEVSPQTRVVGVESLGAAAMNEAIKNRGPIELEKIDAFADGIAVKQVGELTYKIAREVVDEFLQVPEGMICSSILNLYNEEAIVVEPAGAVSIAALDLIKDKIEGKNVCVIVCGGNNDVNRTQEIKERAMLFEGKKHYFIIKFPQRAGALREFLDILGPNDDISHFEYTKKTNRNNGPALVGLELQTSTDFDLLIQRMGSKGIDFQHINNNPLLFEMLV